jgi:pilus assembly protein CpaB
VLSGKNPLFIALALGLLAGLIAYSAIKAQQRKVKAGWETVKILCADVDIPEGTELDQDMVAVKDMPEKFVTESFIKIEEDNTSKRELPIGQRVLIPLKKGDPILVSHFESAREAEFSTMINQKGRAVTIDVAERNAVGLWVRPNDHVDVIGTFREVGGGGGNPKDGEGGGGGNKDTMKAVTLLQNLVVLATGHVNANTTYVPEEEKRYQTVTLLALPEEAEILTLAQETGTLTLLLRNPDDLDYQENRKVLDQKQLLSGNQANELQAKRYKTIQIIRGSKASSEGSAAPAKGE